MLSFGSRLFSNEFFITVKYKDIEKDFIAFVLNSSDKYILSVGKYDNSKEESLQSPSLGNSLDLSVLKILKSANHPFLTELQLVNLLLREFEFIPMMLEGLKSPQGVSIPTLETSISNVNREMESYIFKAQSSLSYN